MATSQYANQIEEWFAPLKERLARTDYNLLIENDTALDIVDLLEQFTDFYVKLTGNDEYVNDIFEAYLRRMCKQKTLLERMRDEYGEYGIYDTDQYDQYGW